MSNKICDGKYCSHKLYKPGDADYTGKWYFKEFMGKKYCADCYSLMYY